MRNCGVFAAAAWAAIESAMALGVAEDIFNEEEKGGRGPESRLGVVRISSVELARAAGFDNLSTVRRDSKFLVGPVMAIGLGF